jgi:anti-sigma regulatory factor (Ser/Thr protein kinase)
MAAYPMTPSRLEHSAYPHDTDDEFVGTVVAFLRDGVRRGDGAAVATTPDRVALLRAGLGPDADGVHFLPDDWYDNPTRAIAGWARVINALAERGHDRVRLVNQVRFGHRPENPRWVRFESALNDALSDCPATMLCPYDRGRLDPDVVASAYRTHPLLLDGRVHANPDFVPPQHLLAELPEPITSSNGRPVLDVPVPDTVAGLRETVRRLARRDGWLPEDRLEELVLAVSEVTSNGVRHGGAKRRLAVWVTDEAVVCEVTDDGGAGPGPLVGYAPPVPGMIGGMGLWLVRQITDGVHIDTSDGVTRVRFALNRVSAA